jgi:uncharacterized protein YfaT (DUF1175 family)
VQLVVQDLKVVQVQQDKQVKLVRQAVQDQLVVLDHKEAQALQVYKGRKVAQEQLAVQDLKAVLVLLERLVLRV